MEMRRIFVILFILLTLCLPAVAGELVVQDLWIAEPPPGAKMLACYLTIKNGLSHDVKLLAAKVEGVKMVELHQTVTKDGMAHMIAQESADIPVGSSLILKPGGYHLMLMHPTRSFKRGDRIQVQLQFDNDSSIETTAVVRSRNN